MALKPNQTVSTMLDNTIIDKIDNLLRMYYVAMGRNNYLNKHGIGKFKALCRKDERIKFKIFWDINSSYDLNWMMFLLEMDDVFVRISQELHDAANDFCLSYSFADSNERSFVLEGTGMQFPGATPLYDNFAVGNDVVENFTRQICGAIDIDFPTVTEVTERKETHQETNEKEILRILRYLYNPYKDDTEETDQQLNWINILEIISLEFNEQICKSLIKIIAQNQFYLDHVPTLHLLKISLEKIKLPTDQYKWLLRVIKKFNIRPVSGHSSYVSLSDNIMYDIYCVHKTFMNNNNKTLDYNLKHFFDDLKINNNEMKDELFIANLLNPPIELPPYYLINDDMESIINYLFATTYLVNDVRSNTKSHIKHVNLIIIPISVVSAINSYHIYAHKHLNDMKRISLHKKYKTFVVSYKQDDPKTFYNQIKDIINHKLIHLCSDGTLTIVVDRSRNDKNIVYIYMIRDNIL
eukprot:463816_1